MQPKLLVTTKRQQEGGEKVNNAHWMKMTSCKPKIRMEHLRNFYIWAWNRLDADWTGTRDAHGVNRGGINKKFRRWEGKLRENLTCEGGVRWLLVGCVHRELLDVKKDYYVRWGCEEVDAYLMLREDVYLMLRGENWMITDLLDEERSRFLTCEGQKWSLTC